MIQASPRRERHEQEKGNIWDADEMRDNPE
jgi:hypothetical protein